MTKHQLKLEFYYFIFIYVDFRVTTTTTKNKTWLIFTQNHFFRLKFNLSLYYLSNFPPVAKYVRLFFTRLSLLNNFFPMKQWSTISTILIKVIRFAFLSNIEVNNQIDCTVFRANVEIKNNCIDRQRLEIKYDSGIENGCSVKKKKI